MRLSSNLITEFQDRHSKIFGEYISPETAEMDLLNLAELVRIASAPTENETNYGEENEIKSKSHNLPNGTA